MYVLLMPVSAVFRVCICSGGIKAASEVLPYPGGMAHMADTVVFRKGGDER